MVAPPTEASRVGMAPGGGEMTPELWGVMGLIRAGDIRGLIQATREMRTKDLRQLNHALQ